MDSFISHSVLFIKLSIGFLFQVIDARVIREILGDEEKNKRCREFYSEDYIWEPVQNVCISCRLCKDSDEAYCRPCHVTTTPEPSTASYTVTSTVTSPTWTNRPASPTDTPGPWTAVPPTTGADLPGDPESQLGPLSIVSIVVIAIFVVVALLMLGEALRRKFIKQPGNTGSANPNDADPDEKARLTGPEPEQVPEPVPQQMAEPAPQQMPGDAPQPLVGPVVAQETESPERCHPMGPDSLTGASSSISTPEEP